nr:hypothetical protein [Tanacetum cinerariifolium]
MRRIQLDPSIIYGRGYRKLFLKELNYSMYIVCQLQVKGLFQDFESLLKNKPIDLLNMDPQLFSASFVLPLFFIFDHRLLIHNKWYQSQVEDDEEEEKVEK